MIAHVQDSSSSFPSLRRAAALFAIAAIPGVALANGYTLVDLGTNRIPQAINPKGEIVGSREYPHTRFDPNPLKWRHGQVKALQDFNARALAVSDGGMIGGEQFDVPISWDPQDAEYFYSLPESAVLGTIVGISDQQAVGFFRDLGTDAMRCFVASSRGGEATDIGTFAQGTFCVPKGINASGQVVGAADVSAGVEHAFVWADGSFTDLGTLPAGSTSIAYAVNDAGHVVGSSFDPSRQADVAFLWSNGRMTELGGTQGHFAQTRALAINARDVAVGTGSVAGDDDSHAVRFEGGKVHDLAAETPGLQHWKLLAAVGIGKDGTIVGYGKKDGRAEGFMLVPR
jgi:probable HAF family extracellular repeat protein